MRGGGAERIGGGGGSTRATTRCIEPERCRNILPGSGHRAVSVPALAHVPVRPASARGCTGHKGRNSVAARAERAQHRGTRARKRAAGRTLSARARSRFPARPRAPLARAVRRVPHLARKTRCVSCGSHAPKSSQQKTRCSKFETFWEAVPILFAKSQKVAVRHPVLRPKKGSLLHMRRQMCTNNYSTK